jgi:hypothetical protein
MKFFFETLTLLAVFFLFTGEPDLWDALHDRAIEAAHGVKEKT